MDVRDNWDAIGMDGEGGSWEFGNGGMGLDLKKFKKDGCEREVVRLFFSPEANQKIFSLDEG